MKKVFGQLDVAIVLKMGRDEHGLAISLYLLFNQENNESLFTAGSDNNEIERQRMITSLAHNTQKPLAVTEVEEQQQRRQDTITTSFSNFLKTEFGLSSFSRTFVSQYLILHRSPHLTYEARVNHKLLLYPPRTSSR